MSTSHRAFADAMLANRQTKEAEMLASTGMTLDQAREQRVANNLFALRGLLAQVALAGAAPNQGQHYFQLGSAEHARALPVFFENLDGDFPEDIQNYMLQHFAHKSAAHYRTALVQRLNNSGARSGEYRYRLAAAVSAMSSSIDEAENVALVKNRQLGECRLALLQRLGRSKSEFASQALVELKDDPDLQKEIHAILERKAKRSSRKAARNAA